MLLTGTVYRSLDDKLRFAIPRSFRDAMGAAGSSVLYLAPGTDGSLELYSEQAFAQLTGKLEDGPRNDRQIRAFHRLFYGQVRMVELDKQGRIRLPAELAQLAPVRAVLPAGAGTLPPAEFAALAGAAFDTAWVTGLVRYSAV